MVGQALHIVDDIAQKLRLLDVALEQRFGGQPLACGSGSRFR
jgi:hypothetical protein